MGTWEDDRKIMELEAEIERLRTALSNIGYGIPGVFTDEEARQCAIGTARVALEEPA